MMRALLRPLRFVLIVFAIGMGVLTPSEQRRPLSKGARLRRAMLRYAWKASR